ncbi:DUF3626 domain-containing protein [Nocardia abscessus]|uniref:DUF3626 domain-containing protein n=1 Tax=Nocardia abscessus TaxID=120957 RepID=UPI002455E0BE|nr:DUF3626 domain-containing protein [Nocardia abscessus]
MDATSASGRDALPSGAGKVSSAGEAALAHVATLSTGVPLDRALRVTVHFHPDVMFGQETVLGALAREGVYRSQFETGLGNGGLTAHPGGARWLWESRMFGGHYDSAPVSSRPKYGSLDHRGDRYGGSPRFGSCYLRLAEHTLERTTFCFPDSVFEPHSFGTAERMNLIALADQATVADPLDHYIEAHLHGVLSLQRDVEELVLDPSYRDTLIHEIAVGLPCRLGWHDGYTLDLDRLRANPGYRGPSVVELGEAVADGHHLLTPRILGAARPRSDPQQWKKLWHYLARYGTQPLSSICRSRNCPVAESGARSPLPQ